MTVSARLRNAGCIAAIGALLSACGSSHAARGSAPVHALSSSVALATPSPSSRPHPQVAKPSRRQVATAITTVRRYLQAWATQGPTRAGRYLVPSQRVTSDQGTPHLSSGTVTSYRLYRWQGPNELTLLVSMNLTFTNDPLAWTRGSNDRFVTARRSGEHGRCRLEFATGP